MLDSLSKSDYNDALVRIKNISSTKLNTNKNPCCFFKHYHCSNYLLIFRTFSFVIRQLLSGVFELLTEINLFNYINWDRRSPNFDVICVRYCLVVFLYARQLNATFTSIEVQKYLNNNTCIKY